jgi:hypothetical protein
VIAVHLRRSALKLVMAGTLYDAKPLSSELYEAARAFAPSLDNGDPRSLCLRRMEAHRDALAFGHRGTRRDAVVYRLERRVRGDTWRVVKVDEHYQPDPLWRGPEAPAQPMPVQAAPPDPEPDDDDDEWDITEADVPPEHRLPEPAAPMPEQPAAPIQSQPPPAWQAQPAPAAPAKPLPAPPAKPTVDQYNELGSPLYVPPPAPGSPMETLLAGIAPPPAKPAPAHESPAHGAADGDEG